MNIEEMMKKAFWETDIPDFAPQAWEKGYQQGANAVLGCIEQALTPQKCLTDIGIDVSPEALIKTALQTIEELKKK